MTFIPVADYDTEVALGNVPGVVAKNKFGRNDASSTALVDIWPESGTIAWQTSASVVDITAGAADVMTTGTGAWEVVLQGLDANYLEVEETVELNGAAVVSSTQAFLRLPRMFVGRCGSDSYNVGEIRAEWSGGSVLANTILPIAGQTEYLAFTVPANEKMVARDLSFGIIDDASSGTRSVQIYIYMRLYNEASTNNYNSWRRVHTVYLNQSGTTLQQSKVWCPNVLPEKTDILCSVISTKADTIVFGRIEYHLHHLT